MKPGAQGVNRTENNGPVAFPTVPAVSPLLHLAGTSPLGRACAPAGDVRTRASGLTNLSRGSHGKDSARRFCVQSWNDTDGVDTVVAQERGLWVWSGAARVTAAGASSDSRPPACCPRRLLRPWIAVRGL